MKSENAVFTQERGSRRELRIVSGRMPVTENGDCSRRTVPRAGNSVSESRCRACPQTPAGEVPEYVALAVEARCGRKFDRDRPVAPAPRHRQFLRGDATATAISTGSAW
jgi:hypothetical protein